MPGGRAVRNGHRRVAMSRGQPEERKPVTVQASPIEVKVDVMPPTVTVETLWDTASLTFAAVLYTALITIVGVLVAPLAFWPDRVLYAVGALLLLVLLITTLKVSVIRLSKWILGKVQS
jgi:hypothetical protein